MTLTPRVRAGRMSRQWFGLRCCMYLLAFVATGCALTYRTVGAESAKLTELGIVENDRQWGKHITIQRVDDDSKVGVGHLGRMELIPGLHRISATWINGGLRGWEVSRWLRISAGHHYRLVALPDFVAMKWTFAVIDVETDRPVDFDGGHEAPEWTTRRHAESDAVH